MNHKQAFEADELRSLYRYAPADLIHVVTTTSTVRIVGVDPSDPRVLTKLFLAMSFARSSAALMSLVLIDADGLEFLFGALRVDRVRQFGAESDALQLARHGVGFLDGNFTVNDTDESD
ncbi:hypothetical protein PI125_g21571 [Phytophthora idaei]|nr:hypothetical protein PI125_g21571 [Phytophthora idaei]